MSKKPTAAPILIRTLTDYKRFRQGIQAGTYHPDQVFLTYKFGRKKRNGAFSSPCGWTQYHLRLSYVVGATMTVERANTDSDRDCGAGVNVATVDWIKHNFSLVSGGVFLVLFRTKDVAAVPWDKWNSRSSASNGKFRLFRGHVVGRLDPDSL